MTSSSWSLIASLVLICLLQSPGALAYGGGGSSSSSCQEPQFYEESPPGNAKIASLNEISLVASANTDTASLELEVNGQRLQPELSQRRSGEWLIKQRLPEAITQAGKVRITLTAKSKDGCSAFHPYYVEISP